MRCWEKGYGVGSRNMYGVASRGMGWGVGICMVWRVGVWGGEYGVRSIGGMGLGGGILYLSGLTTRACCYGYSLWTLDKEFREHPV